MFFFVYSKLQFRSPNRAHAVTSKNIFSTFICSVLCIIASVKTVAHLFANKVKITSTPRHTKTNGANLIPISLSHSVVCITTRDNVDFPTEQKCVSSSLH